MAQFLVDAVQLIRGERLIFLVFEGKIVAFVFPHRAQGLQHVVRIVMRKPLRKLLVAYCPFDGKPPVLFADGLPHWGKLQRNALRADGSVVAGGSSGSIEFPGA